MTTRMTTSIRGSRHCAVFAPTTPDSGHRFALHSAVGQPTPDHHSARGRDQPETSPIAMRDVTRRSPRPNGCTQATRLARPSGRAPLAPRHRLAGTRGVLALPRAEAAAPRLPELRLL